jgi:hypothetical protein
MAALTPILTPVLACGWWWLADHRAQRRRAAAAERMAARYDAEESESATGQKYEPGHPDVTYRPVGRLSR